MRNNGQHPKVSSHREKSKSWQAFHNCIFPTVVVWAYFRPGLTFGLVLSPKPDLDVIFLFMMLINIL